MNSTEGIQTQLIRTTFDDENQVLGPWTEIENETSELLKTFNMELVTAAHNINSSSSIGSTSINPSSRFTNPTTVQATVTIDDMTPTTSTEEVPHFIPATETSSVMVPKVASNKKAELDTTESSLSDVTVDPISVRAAKQSKDTKNKNTTECLMRIWDFGGQLEFYSTHHLFLDAHAVNLIVMDITKNFNEIVQSKFDDIKGASIPQTAGGFFDYWLNTIHQKATSQGVTPTVVVVLTHIDQFTSSVDQYIDNVLAYISNKPYSTYISRENIFTVDNKSGKKESFLQMRKQIFQKATYQKTWGLDRPTRWMKAEASIQEEAKNRSVKYLNNEQVLDLTSKLGMKKVETESFLDFHHVMGDLVYFNQAELNNIVITDPQWLVDQFKALITTHTFLDKRNIDPLMLDEYKQQAIVKHTLLEKVWKDNEIQFLIHLLQKFHLMVPVPYSHAIKYIIPCMLPPRKSDMYETVPFKNMNMMYSSVHTMKDGESLSAGDFHKFVAKFSEVTQWRICEADHLTYTDVSFKPQDGVRVAFTLLKELRVTVWCSKQAKRKGAVSLLPTVYDKVMKNLFLKLKDDRFLLACPKSMSIEWSESTVGECMVRFKAKTHEAFLLQDKLCPVHKRYSSRSRFQVVHASYSTAVTK